MTGSRGHSTAGVAEGLRVGLNAFDDLPIESDGIETNELIGLDLHTLCDRQFGKTSMKLLLRFAEPIVVGISKVDGHTGAAWHHIYDVGFQLDNTDSGHLDAANFLGKVPDKCGEFCGAVAGIAA